MYHKFKQKLSKKKHEQNTIRANIQQQRSHYIQKHAGTIEFLIKRGLPALVVLCHGVQQVCERVLRTACVGKYQYLGLGNANSKIKKCWLVK